MRTWWRTAVVAAAACLLAGGCGSDEPNAFDRAQNMPCEEWEALPRVERTRHVGVLREMQDPSDELLREIEAQCTSGRHLAKALLEANLSFEERDEAN